ncbi:zinc-ribbon domain containing protein [Pseudoalteromonas ruthenica]|uniref:zinc-ribbon domain containing protein n=1 Tax=Pseudoalteromonas ruthenica TaxID=151081 RepID=UPI00124632B7|nr:zinc-ribbon domain containing protein [Pseudoalteromonas ruthenica]
MSKKRKSRFKEYVDHPRYGDKPIYSGEKFTLEEILRAHWRYSEDSIFPETAIKADIEKQNYSIYPRPIYVDIQKKCESCGKWFLFFAKEQKYWYESLRFYIDADCVKCVNCRKKEQEVKHLMSKYEQLLTKSERSEAQTKDLKNIALELFQLGYIRNKNKVDKIS